MFVVSLMIYFSNNMINNRPVLLWANRANITEKQMKSSVFGFKVSEVYTSSLISNARKVEDEIQRRLQPLELGSRRLHRKIGKGKRFANKLGMARVHRVFLTTSSKVQELLKKKIIIVNK